MTGPAPDAGPTHHRTPAAQHRVSAAGAYQAGTSADREEELDVEDRRFPPPGDLTPVGSKRAAVQPPGPDQPDTQEQPEEAEEGGWSLLEKGLGAILLVGALLLILLFVLATLIFNRLWQGV